MQAETLNDRLLVQPSGPVIEEDTTHIVPSLPTDNTALLPAERSLSLVVTSSVVPSCEIHDKDVLCDIPGTVAVCYGSNCNVNSLKYSNENCQALCGKQEHKEVIPLRAINNTEFETRLHKAGVDGITQEGGDAIVPDINYLAGKSSPTDNGTINDGINPTIPVIFEAGSFAALNMDPPSHQDSSSPLANHDHDSHFMQYCFAAEKESLVNEESDYELELSPTLESQPLQQTSIVDCSQHSVSSVPAICDSIKSPHVESVRSSPLNASLENIHTLHCSETADDGSNTVEQALPGEAAKQFDCGHVCRKDDVENTEDNDDFKDDSENTLIIIDSELQSSKNSGNSFPQIINDNIVDTDQPAYIDYHLVPSIDQSYDDGPSCLLRAMDIVERKESHVLRPRTTWERILFTGNYYGKQHQIYFFSLCNLYCSVITVLWNCCQSI